jgi:hypothetical protein
MKRRRFLVAGATVGLGSLAGCVGTTPTADDATETTTETVGPTTSDPSGETDSRPSPPTSDVAGYDFDDVPRYPEAVRTDYIFREDDGESDILVEYLAPALVREVAAFYEQSLPENGWTIHEFVPTAAGAGALIASRKQGERDLEMHWVESERFAGHCTVTVRVVDQTGK